MMCGCLGVGMGGGRTAAVAVAEVAAAAAAGDRSIIRTARFVIMIAMLMMALLLQLNYSATTAVAAAALTPTDSEPSATSTFHAPVFNVNQEFAPLDSRMLLKRIDLDWKQARFRRKYVSKSWFSLSNKNKICPRCTFIDLDRAGDSVFSGKIPFIRSCFCPNRVTFSWIE